jgi:pimeloyl-ACP methyl ester carboxylesterase
VVALPHDERGRGEAIVLIHAGVADRRMWAEHLEPLAGAGYRVVAVDLPGFGDAPAKATAKWSAVVATLDELGIERAALVGNSLGAGVALRTAVVAPERVSALVLVSALAPGREPSEQLVSVWTREEEEFDAGGPEAAVQAVLAAWTLPDAPAELRERVATMQRRVYELEDLDLPQPTDPLEKDPAALQALTIPTLILAGEHDMVDFTAGADQLAAAIPDSRLSVIRGAGHLAPLETPVQFRELVISFLNEA